jgi:hypothetical protein
MHPGPDDKTLLRCALCGRAVVVLASEELLDVPCESCGDLLPKKPVEPLVVGAWRVWARFHGSCQPPPDDR